MIACTGKRTRASVQATIIEAIEAEALHRTLIEAGFHLRPFRVPAGLPGGNLRLRLVWSRKDGFETQTVRLTHVVTVPDRP